jgi:hypothetical protein
VSAHSLYFHFINGNKEQHIGLTFYLGFFHIRFSKGTSCVIFVNGVLQNKRFHNIVRFVGMHCSYGIIVYRSYEYQSHVSLGFFVESRNIHEFT